VIYKLKNIFELTSLKPIKSERFKRLGKEFSWIVLGQAATVLGALFGIRILTGLLSPTEYGQLALGMTIATLFQKVMLGPLSNGASRFYAPAREANSLHAYIIAVHRMVLVSSGSIVLVAFFCGVMTFFIGLQNWIEMGVAALVFALLTGYNEILSGIQNAARQRVIVALHQGLASWGKFLVAAGLIIWLSATSTITMFGYGIAMLFVLTSQYFFFKRIIAKANSYNIIEVGIIAKWRAKIFAYSWPFATWALLSWGRAVSDRWSLEIFSSTSDVGFYTVLFQLGYYPIAMFVNIATTLLAPIYFERAGDASDNARVINVFNMGWNINKYALFILLMFVILSFFFHESIFSLLASKQYTHISYLLPSMLLAAVLYESSRFLSIVLQAKNLNHLLIVPNNVSHLISLFLIIAGAAWNGINGIVLAYILQSFIFFVWIMFLFKRQYLHLRAQLLIPE